MIRYTQSQWEKNQVYLNGYYVGWADGTVTWYEKLSLKSRNHLAKTSAWFQLWLDNKLIQEY